MQTTTYLKTLSNSSKTVTMTSKESIQVTDESVSKKLEITENKVTRPVRRKQNKPFWYKYVNISIQLLLTEKSFSQSLKGGKLAWMYPAYFTSWRSDPVNFTPDVSSNFFHRRTVQTLCGYWGQSCFKHTLHNYTVCLTVPDGCESGLTQGFNFSIRVNLGSSWKLAVFQFYSSVSLI